MPLTDARVVALPRTAADVTAADVRDRLDAGAPLGTAATDAAGDVPPALTTLTVDRVAGADRDALPGRRVVVAPGTTVLDAVTAMLEAGAPVVDLGGRTRVAADDLPLDEDAGLDRLLAALGGAPDVATLADAAPTTRPLLRDLVRLGADVVDVGRVQAAVGDALVRRLLAIAARELGAAPADFAWLAFGSHARREQVPGSDQDHGLVHAAGLGAAERRWFARLGAWMTDALERCGLPRCPGGVMASEPGWRHDPDGWRAAVRGWTDPTDAGGLVGAGIGFDVRAVAGTGALGADAAADGIRASIAAATATGLTAARLASAAVARRPPNPLWGRVGRNPLGPAGTRLGRFDLKRDGIQPIVDLARVHALARGGGELATTARLAAAVEAGQVTAELGGTLVEGLRLLTWTRLSAHLGHGDGDGRGDVVDWGALPPAVRRQVSETFGAVRTAQDALRVRHRLAPGR